MRSRHSVTVDAGILAVPPVDSATDDAAKYVEMLLEWKKLLDDPWIAICMSEHASEYLFANGLYPLRGQLRELFIAHGIEEYDSHTVAKIANWLLEKTPTFESYYSVKYILYEHLKTVPDVIRLTAYDGLQPDLDQCITLIAVLRKHCSQSLGGYSLILRKAPSKVVQVKVQIYEIEHNRDDIPALPRPPEYFEGDVLVCDDFNGVLECLDDTAILVGATDDLGIKFAIRIALFKSAILQHDAPEWGALQVSEIGPSFRESCQKVCTDHGGSLPDKILRSIVETIEGRNLSAVHALRTGKGGNEPQRMRGSDKAQRRDIDREFHLHYWKCDNGTVELASVVHHDDFSIPER